MKRIFLVTDESMFGRGIERLLSQDARFNIMTQIVSQKADLCQAIAGIQTLRPDVVILDTRSLADSAQLAVIEILRLVPGIKVIGLNLNENIFHVYRSTQREANNILDLMNEINEP